jgi:hypothetical protein
VLIDSIRLDTNLAEAGHEEAFLDPSWNHRRYWRITVDSTTCTDSIQQYIVPYSLSSHLTQLLSGITATASLASPQALAVTITADDSKNTVFVRSIPLMKPPASLNANRHDAFQRSNWEGYLLNNGSIQAIQRRDSLVSVITGIITSVKTSSINGLGRFAWHDGLVHERSVSLIVLVPAIPFIAIEHLQQLQQHSSIQSIITGIVPVELSTRLIVPTSLAVAVATAAKMKHKGFD